MCRRKLLHARIECFLNVCSAAKPAPTHEIERPLNRRSVGRDRRRLKYLCLAIEENQIKRVCRMQGTEQGVERLITSLEFFPLHRQRGIEQDDHVLGRSRGLRSSRSRDRRLLTIAEQGFHGKKTRLVGAPYRRRLRRRRLSAHRIPVCKNL